MWGAEPQFYFLPHWCVWLYVVSGVMQDYHLSSFIFVPHPTPRCVLINIRETETLSQETNKIKFYWNICVNLPPDSSLMLLYHRCLVTNTAYCLTLCRKHSLVLPWFTYSSLLMQLPEQPSAFSLSPYKSVLSMPSLPKLLFYQLFPLMAIYSQYPKYACS